jgi:L-lysine 2,3-aminomutase
MPDIITRKSESVEQNWLKELANAISDPSTLLQQLNIETNQWQSGFKARQLFAQRVPQSFIDRMEKGNPNDPLLKQVLPVIDEFELHEGYSSDPLNEQNNTTPGLLHKYKNRALLIVKGGCAINCRYCFRRHFPYQDNKGSKAVWQQSLTYIAQQPDINEVILSGGDPLMAKDSELLWLINEIAAIPQIKTVRIHTRLPVVIPSRVTDGLCEILANCRLRCVLITHINHANEIDHSLINALHKLKQVGVTLLNQAVLLKDVNDSVAAQVSLSEGLFDAGVLPYYLHVLDKVQGSAHFFVSDDQARAIIAGLLKEVSGYLVPKLTREEGGRESKTPLNLYLE